MKARKCFVVVLFTICGLTAIIGSAVATPLVSDDNLLSGKSVAVSSWNSYLPQFVASHVTDGTDDVHVFADTDADRQMAIYGFDSSVGLIRIWDKMDRTASTVTILSSTNDNGGSLVSGNYSALITVSSIAWIAGQYADIAVSAPAGTKSLLFLWGPGSNAPGTATTEVQAWAPTPEPSTLVLLATGLLGLLAYAWRKRR